MLSKILNLLFVQLFILQTSAFAASNYVSAVQLKEAVKVLKGLSPQEQNKLFISIVPLVPKEDIENISSDKDFLKDTIHHISVEGDTIVLNLKNEKVIITDIDLNKLTATVNGTKLDFTKPLHHNALLLSEGTPKTSWLDYIFPSAHAQATLPLKAKTLWKLAAGALAAVLAIAGVSYGYLNLKDDAVLEEVKVTDMAQQVQEECNKSKAQIQKSKLGELSSEYVQKIKDKYQALDKAVRDGTKMSFTKDQLKWVTQSKTCYQEAIELIEVKSVSVKDDSSREVKDVGVKSSDKAVKKKASEQ